MTRTALPILTVLALFACDNAGNDTDFDTETDTDPTAVDRVARVVISPDGPTGDVVDASNTLAFDLYAELADDDEDNLFFSPFSTLTALGMTAAGANGTTADQMADVLSISDDSDAWHTALGALSRDLNGELGRGYTLNIANRLFGQQDYPFETSFLTLVDDAYDAPLEEWDFVSDPSGGRDHINGWVDDQTNDRIVDLLPSTAITRDTRLVLANAIYFLADWRSPFDPEQTYDGAFTTSDGTVVTTPMMNMDLSTVEEHAVRSTHTDGVAIVQLPYEDDELSMVLIVPEGDTALADVEASLDALQYRAWVDAAQPSEAWFAMPKFTLEYEAELSVPLRALGMPDAFDPVLADFTGIADLPDEPLHIGGVFHKAFVAVDELGTEAAAATAVVVNTDTSVGDTILANRPFLFAIQDDLTGTVLFMGRVADPS